MTEYATHEGDTDSPGADQRVLTQRIKDLTEHLKEHKHGHHSQARACCCSSVVVVVFLGYLQKVDINRYRSIIRAPRPAPLSLGPARTRTRWAGQ